MKLVSLKNSIYEKFELKNTFQIMGGATTREKDSTAISETDCCTVEDVSDCWYSSWGDDDCKD